MKVKSIPERNLAIFVGGQSASALGDAVHRLALSLYMLDLTGSALQVGLVLVTTALPALLLGPFVGRLFDRARAPQGILFLSDLARAGAVLLIPLSGNASAIYALSLVANSLGFVTKVGVNTLIPAAFPEERLMFVNSVTRVGTRAMHVLGPTLSGLLYSALGPLAPFAVDAATFLLAALSYLGILLKVQPQEKKRRPETRADQRSAIGEVFRSRVVGLIFLFMAAAAVTSGAFNVLLVVLVRAELGLSAAEYGYVLSVGAMGLLLGALGTLRMSRGGSGSALTRILAASIVADGLAIAWLGLAQGFWTVAFLMFVVGASSSVATVVSTTGLQLHVPEGLRGRIFSLYEQVFTSLSMASMLLGGALADGLGVRPIYLVGGVFQAAITGTAALLARFGGKDAQCQEQD